MHDVSVPIGDDLNLDVPGVLDELLQEHRPLPERSLRLPLRAPHGLDEILRLPYRAHPPPAAPGARLDQNRETDALGLLPEALLALVLLARVAGNGRHVGLARELLRPHLVSHPLHHLRRRSDPDEPCLLDRPREVRVLREKAVPWVDRLGPALPRGSDDLLDVQVALRGGGRSHRVGFVGEPDVHRVLVRLRVDGHGGYAELAAGPDHAHRHLPAVGDEQLPERGLVEGRSAQAHDSLHAGSRFSRKAPKPS
jgi:hypothetical protein